MEVEKAGISEIFHRPHMLEIPFFQRSYVWEKDNWERFLDDVKAVSNESESYFMGSIILQRNKSPLTEHIGLRTVIDGQQRLTTIVLFFRELCIQLDEVDFYKSRFFKSESNNEVLLMHNDNDLALFKKIISHCKDVHIDLNGHGKSNITRCYNFFYERRHDLKQLNHEKIFENLYFVLINLEYKEDAQQIFDTINSLGVPLTSAELIKNELFTREDEELYAETWKKHFEGPDKNFWDNRENISGDRTHIDLLLFSHLLSSCENHQDKSFIKVRDIFKNYKKMLSDKDIKNRSDREEIIKDIIESSKLYRKYVTPNLIKEKNDVRSAIDRLNVTIFGLGFGITVVPYIVYLSREIKDEAIKGKMFRLIETYLVRRTICKGSTRGYGNLFASLVQKRIKTYECLCGEIGRDIPNDTELEKAFTAGTAPRRNNQSRAILYLIESSLRSDRESTALFPLLKYTLEHIMPKEWSFHWNDGLDEIDQDKRKEAVKSFGNLTIITAPLNKSIKNAGWQEKKTGKSRNEGLVECSTGIKIISDYLNLDKWDENEILKRAEFLFERARISWPVPQLGD